MMDAVTPRTLGEALTGGPVVLDGGVATELERRGHDLSGALWSARLLRDDPAAIEAVHAAYAGAGAQVVTTASYQATFEGFARAGLDAGTTERLLRSSVELARRGAPDAWVAGSVGPFGALLADGSEYTGAYTDPAWDGHAGGGLTVDELRRFHGRRMQVLAEAGADVLACETVPAAAEAEALVAEAQSLGVPIWLSLTTVVDDDGVVRTRRGEPAADVFAMAAGVEEVLAVGVNCTYPSGVPAAVTTAAASGKPVVVYPNSGEGWDASGRRWTGEVMRATDDVPRWVAAGARLIGGCCRIGPDEIREIAAALPR
jgi:S-methylmethionine-dependent homocysteine/selenocysteine methylase